MKPGDKYQPSNGSEGDWFTGKFCWQCIHCDPDPEGAKQCDILCKSLVFDTKDEEYPSEWTYDDNGKPTCTAWQKWDWGNDGDPDDEDNPKAPPALPDPDQMNMFPLYPTEIDFGNQKKIVVEKSASLGPSEKQ